MVAARPDSTGNPLPPAGLHHAAIRRALVLSWRAAGVTPAAEVVLSSLLDRFDVGRLTLADDAVTGWCSMRTLATDRALHVGTVNKRLRALESAGLIARSVSLAHHNRVHWSIPLPAELVADLRSRWAELGAGPPTLTLVVDNSASRAPRERAASRASRGRARSNQEGTVKKKAISPVFAAEFDD